MKMGGVGGGGSGKQLHGLGPVHPGQGRAYQAPVTVPVTALSLCAPGLSEGQARIEPVCHFCCAAEK